MHRASLHLALFGSATVFVAVACSPGVNLTTGGSGGQDEKAASGSNTIAEGPSGTNATTAAFMTGASDGSGMTSCVSDPDEDKDGDGYSVNQGDCNDCDKNVNPGALEVIVTDPDPMTGMVPTPADEDCDGTVDNPPAPDCDAGLALDSANAGDFAKAIELCKVSTGAKDWGVVSSSFVRGDGSATTVSEQVGILDNFGPNVPARAGAKMISVSSGHARIPGQAGACNQVSCTRGSGVAPPLFPQDVPGCPGTTVVNDDAAVEFDVRAPTNATGYTFDFKFYTFEYPDYICNLFNDQFIAYVSPPPMGAINGNVSFDSANSPVSVNIAFFDVCDVPGNPCYANVGEMQGTGFDSWTGGADDGYAGGTTWLQTTAPVDPGSEFKIRYAIWDAQDTWLDSTAVIDNFKWIASGGTVVMVGTNPVPQ